MKITADDKIILRDTAWQSISYGLQHQNKAEKIHLHNFPPHLTANGASFVSLFKHSDLRGCIGSLEATRALVSDVNYNANAAAFSDPRFPALREPEIDQLSLEISVLSPPIEMLFDSEQNLMEQLRPDIDGVILVEKHRRATFLPVVWEQLPDKASFLKHLKQKAGLPLDYWSDTIRFERYSTTSF